jgi:hypothetical protein
MNQIFKDNIIYLKLKTINKVVKINFNLFKSIKKAGSLWRAGF